MYYANSGSPHQIRLGSPIMAQRRLRCLVARPWLFKLGRSRPAELFVAFTHPPRDLLGEVPDVGWPGRGCYPTWTELQGVHPKLLCCRHANHGRCCPVCSGPLDLLEAIHVRIEHPEEVAHLLDRRCLVRPSRIDDGFVPNAGQHSKHRCASSERRLLDLASCGGAFH